MKFDEIKAKLRGLNPVTQNFWAGSGVGRGWGSRLADPPVERPTAREIELAVEEGRFIEPIETGRN